MQCIEDGTDDQLLIRPMMEISSSRAEIMHGCTLRVCVYAGVCVYACVRQSERRQSSDKLIF